MFVHLGGIVLSFVLLDSSGRKHILRLIRGQGLLVKLIGFKSNNLCNTLRLETKTIPQRQNVLSG